jgi:hypothetical protein
MVRKINANAIASQRLLQVPSSANRISHIVQAIQKHHVIVRFGRKILGRSLLERHAVRRSRVWTPSDFCVPSVLRVI